MKSKVMLMFNIIMPILIVAADVCYITVNCSSYITKTIASSLFVICSLVNFIVFIKNCNKNIKFYATFMLIGTIFSMMGDIFLIDYFMIGAILFAVGHILYLISYMFLQKFSIKDLIVWLILCGVCACVILIPDIYNFDGLKPLIVAYSFIISGMLAKSFNNLIFNKKHNNLQFLLLFIGSLMFFLSDLMLLLYNFAFGSFVFDVLCLSLYYPALAVLSTSIWYIQFLNTNEAQKMSFARKIWCRCYQIMFRILLPLMPYRQPKLFNSYADMAETIKQKGLTKVLIVTDESLIKLGLVSDMKHALDDANIEYSIFDEVMPNPTIECIEKAKEFYILNSCQAIIAIGGGSVMDCAKIVGARIVKQNQSVQKMKGLLKIRKKLPLMVAIPTTAGTGSETTLAAVITDEKTHQKYPINDFCLIPHYTVLDCNLTLGLPKSLTATTGMDALTHAVEAYIGRSTTAYTRRMSIGAIKLIVDNLYLCYQNGTDFEARKNMLKASFMAGNAFTRSYVGYVHAIAHSLGGQYGVAHGLANAVILPKMLRFYGKSCERKLAKLAKIVGLAEKNDKKSVACEKFIYFIEQMNMSMEIPKTIEQIKEEDIDLLATLADKEANPLYPVPRLYSKQELGLVYKYIKDGSLNA